MSTVRDQIYARLDEIALLLKTAECDGQLLPHSENSEVISELESHLSQFTEAVDYYVDN